MSKYTDFLPGDLLEKIGDPDEKLIVLAATADVVVVTSATVGNGTIPQTWGVRAMNTLYYLKCESPLRKALRIAGQQRYDYTPMGSV